MAGKVLTGFCPNKECQTQMFFIANSPNKQICLKCSESHEIKSISNIQPVTDPGAAIRALLQTFKQSLNSKFPEHLKGNFESIKVKGLSNYSAKLISPLLTIYGLDKKTQTVKLLSEMGQGESFDCSLLSDRAFLIEQENIFVKGYGRLDAIVEYLKETLEQIYKVNGGEENIVPIYVDSDGHCLLHAISRALVGHEIFWHPFSTNLKTHLIERKEQYRLLFKDFIEDTEWADIIAEADPNFSQTGEIYGLRNIHIFGLANCLHRPIILIDSAEGMFSKGDYCGVFLPYLIPIQKCKDSNGVLNKPILISWSNKGRNHFVPLVGIQGKHLPKFPASLLPKVWGLPQHLIYNYIDFDKGCCIIGGSKSLSDRYLTKLIGAMENHFRLLKGVAPSVVTDVYYHICRQSDGMTISQQDVIDTAYSLVKEERLHKCMFCQTVMEEVLPFPLSWLFPGGKFYDEALRRHKTLKNGYYYRFPEEDICCSYNAKNNRLMYVQDAFSLKCKNCEGPLRVLKADGTVSYLNGDQLPIPASKNSKCGCGFKHFWNGKNYDNLPVRVPILLEWNGEKISDYIFWFQYEEDDSLNSNAFELAQQMVSKHFPGEFGSERLVEKVVDQIFCYVLDSKPKEKSIECLSKSDPLYGGDPATTLNKIILRGAKSKTLHKEELNVSKKEEILRKKIEHHATVKQKRLSSSSSPQKVSSMSAEKIAEIKTDAKNVFQNSNCRVRISMIGGKNETYLITNTTTYKDIQDFVEEKFKIDKNDQLIKFGFPPKTLNASNISEIKPGDRLVVHVKKIVKEKPLIKEEQVSSTTLQYSETTKLQKTSSELVHNADSTRAKNLETTDSSNDKKMSEFPFISQDQAMLSDSLFSLIQSVDLWEWSCTQQKLFQKGSLFYNRALLDLGKLSNGQHITLPYFPQKVFVYNEQEEELYLCLGKNHVPVKVLTDEELILARNVSLKQDMHKHVNISNDFKSFSGKGYSLSRPADSQTELTDKYNNVDMSQSQDDESMPEIPSNKIPSNEYMDKKETDFQSHKTDYVMDIDKEQ